MTELNMRILIPASILTSILATNLALAAERDLLGQRLTATCANCHGTNGFPSGTAIPGIAGLPKDRLMDSMQAFKSGARPATIMHQIAKGYTDEQIESIASYLAAQEK
jgi:cytochrome c553